MKQSSAKSVILSIWYNVLIKTIHNIRIRLRKGMSALGLGGELL